MELEKIEYLLTEAGEVLTEREDILNYLKQSSELLKCVRQSPKFASDFKEGHIEDYLELEDTLKLQTEEEKKLGTAEVYHWMEQNLKSSKKGK